MAMASVPLHLLPHRPMTPAWKASIAVFFVVGTVGMLGFIARTVAVDSSSWPEALFMLPLVLAVMAVVLFVQTIAHLAITRDFSAAPERYDDDGGHQILDQTENV